MNRAQRIGALLGLVLACAPLAGFAQERTVTATAGARYEANGFVRVFAGSNWRDLWTTPVQVPMLDLGTHGGGLTPERTGGRQSRTLHFQGGNGRRYIFRSVDKYLHDEALPVALRRTPVGDVVQDQISSLMPAAGLLVGPLYEAAGLLHPWPTLVVMPDDPRLGEYREEYAGMLGQIEENPQEGPDDTPGFAGSSKLVGVDNLLERLDESPEHRVHAPEYLAARLIQFMIADTDRGGDQWRFAEFPNPAGTGSIWRPVARDHDFAFMRNGGLIGTVSRRVYPKLARFDDTFESLRTLTFMTYDMDRRLLVELPRERWDSVVTALQSRLTDEVLRSAADRLPQEWQPVAAEHVFTGLRARRDALHTIAADFFAMISREADVYATAEDERAEVERLTDGSVEVRLYPAVGAVVVADGQPAPPASSSDPARAGARPYFQRRFLPRETSEIRLYLLGGNDAARVTGSARHSIRVRVIGGAGDDVLVDSSAVAQSGASTVFYTAGGADRVVRSAATRVDDRDFVDWLPGRPHDLRELASADDEVEEDAEGGEEEQQDDDDALDENVAERLSGRAYHDWGSHSGVGPYADFRSGTGLIIGGGPSHTRYGFRRQPYRYFVSANVLYAVQNGGFGVELFGDYHPENTRLALSLDASATQFETFRFYGYGNDTDIAAGISPRVERDQVTVRPALYWEDAGVYVGAGPIFRYGDPRYETGSPMSLLRPEGAAAYAQAGGALDLRVTRGITSGRDARGFALDAGAAAYPALLDVSEPFGRTHAVARAWVPLGQPFLALRAGGEMAWGEFPVHEAAFLGGRNSLRGFETDRFAGDAAAYGSTELHLPLGTLTLLVRGE
ncbi:MAG TPA: hypothetical protein VFZ69_10115, partial [Longimicrobiales bacterium]